MLKIERRFIMKVNTIHNFAKLLVTILAVGLVAVNAWADVAKWDYSSDGLSNTTKGQITVSYAQNSGTNPVAVSSNLLRLYRQNASPYNGCSATFTASSGYQITAIKVKFSGGRTSARGKIDNGSYQDVFSGGNSATVTISSLTATSYSIQNQATGSTTVTIDSIVVTYSSTCDKKVTVSNGGSSTNGAITSITTSPVATCSSTAANRQVSIVVTPSTGYVAPTALSVGSTTGTVTSTKISRTDNGNGTFTFVYQYNQNDNGTISYNATCVGKQCTLIFNQNSGTGGQTSNLTATYGSAMPAISGVPTRTHYDFAGYYDGVGGTGNKYYNSDGTSATNWNKNTTANTTLYAKWTEHTLINYRTVCCTPLGYIKGAVTYTNPTTAVLTWEDLDDVDATTPYVVTYRTGSDEFDDDNVGSITTNGEGKKTCTITGLNCNTDYDFKISITADDGYCDKDTVLEDKNSGTWTVTSTITNGSENSVPKTACGNYTATYTASTDYHFPDAITVSGASSYTWTKATGTLTISGANITDNISISITCPPDACDDYSFFYGTTKGSENNFECFSFVTGSTDTWLTDIWTIPSSDQWTYVGEPDWDPSSGKSANLQLSSMPYALNHANNLGSISTGVMEGAEGYVKICTNSSDANRYVGFIPAGYVFRWGTDGSGWSSIAFTGKTSAIEEEDWYTPLQTWTSSNADDYTYVGLKTSSGYVWANRSETRRPVFFVPNSEWLAKDAQSKDCKFAMYYFDNTYNGWSAFMEDPDGDGIYEAWIPNDHDYTSVIFVRFPNSKGSTGNWDDKYNQTGNLTLPSDKNVFTITSGSGDAYTGSWSLYDKKGTFHISANSNTNNWYCHFLPHHVLHYDANSGSGAPADQTIAVNASPCQLTVSTTEPTRTGYTFAGWNESSSAAAKDDDWDGGDTHTMSADVTLYAVWTANTNTPYTVKHYKQKLDGTYDSTPDDTDNLTGTTATSVTPDRKSYEGFTAPSGQTVTILADGSRVVEYQYTRNSYTLTWTTDGDDLTGSYTTGSTKYGASITAPNTPTKTGYTFAGWDSDVASTMPAADTEYTATWTANTNTAYTVKHYKQKLDGTYPASPDETDNLTGTTATSVTPARKSYTGFTAPDAQTETIAADGSLVITYNYTRNKYNVAVASVGNVTITATPSGGSAIAESANADVYYGQSVTLANSSITSGYFWAGWKVTKQSDGTDVTASVVSTNTLTVPAYAINVSAGLYSNAIAWCDPDVEVTGDVHLTSYNGVPVYATSDASNLIEISSSDMGSATKMEIGYLNGSDDEVDKADSPFRLCNDGVSPANYNIIDESAMDLDYEWGTSHSIKYTPDAYDQRDNYKLQLTFKRGDKVLKTVTHAIYGRALPEEFVIASKYLGHWYALPNTMGTSLETVTPIMITVDNATTPTEASLAPSTTIYKGAARYRPGRNVNAIRFTSTGSNWLETGSTAQLKLSTTAAPTEGVEDKQAFYLNSSTFGAYELAISGKKLGMYDGNMGMYADPAYTSEDIYLLPVNTKYTPVDITDTDWMQDVIGVTASVSATKLGIEQEDGTETDPVTLSSSGTSHAADFDGDIDFTGLKDKTLWLKWYDGSTLVGGSQVTVPSIILAGSNSSWYALETAIEKSTTLDDIVVLSKPMTVGDAHAKAKKIVMDKSGGNTGKLTIQPNKGLEVASTVKVYNGTNFVATGEADLVLESDEDGNASLIFDNSNSCKATVQMYSIGDIVDANTWNWQFMGTPFTSANALYSYYGSYLYEWKAGGYWDAVANGGTMTPFTGYCITQDEPTYYVMDGTLNPTTSQTLTVPADVEMVFANSWSAPIYISAFTDEAFDIDEKTVYLFNTGFAPNKGDAKEGTAAGTYVVVPIHSSPYTGDSLIAPMQGFYVDNTGKDKEAGTITMDYATVVRPTRDRNIVAGAMHAPKRAENEPAVMKIKATGSRYSERIVILEREDFSTGFDNGWDGKNLNEPGVAPILYALRADGTKDAVSAIPAYEGTVVGFRKGEDNAYTFSFEYDGDETLYLNDLQTQTSTLIDAEHTYAFSTESNNAEARFIISATPIQQMPTGIGNDANDANDGIVKVRKVIINDQLYIIRGGRMYSAEGQMVK